MDPARLTPSAEYLNVDLEVRSRSNLAPLAEALSEKLFVLHVGRIPGGFLAAFETGGPTLRPDVALRRFATVMGALKDPARKLWLDAYDRVFDFGFEHTTGRGIGAIALSRATVRLMASLNARVAVSIYPRARPGRARASVAPGRRRRGDAPAKSR